MSTSVPGHGGLPIVGDKSLEFYSDPVIFMKEKMKEYKSRIFLTRFLGKPTVFVASNEGVKQVLKDTSLEMGYKAFMGDIFGDNLLFFDGIVAENIRRSLSRLFTNDLLLTMQSTIERVTSQHVSELPLQTPIDFYQHLKEMTTTLCLELFLGLDTIASKELTEDIVSLTTQHWHGIIAVPLNIKMPFTGSQSTFSSAIQARNKLAAIVKDRLSSSDPAGGGGKSGCPQRLLTLMGSDLELTTNHLVLFICALVPKALASLLSSFVGFTSLEENRVYLEEVRGDRKKLHRLLLETARLAPPFQGGRRLIRKDSFVEGLRLRKGQALFYSSYWAQRDPTVFHEPNQFDPTRWTDRDMDAAEGIFAFGHGLRSCPGQGVIWSILLTYVSTLMEGHTWNLHHNPKSLEFKWLPITRLSSDTLTVFGNTLGDDEASSQVPVESSRI